MHCLLCLQYLLGGGKVGSIASLHALQDDEMTFLCQKLNPISTVLLPIARVILIEINC